MSRFNSSIFICSTIYSLLFFLACRNNESNPETITSSEPLSAAIKLKSLSPAETGISFNNKINDEGRINIFTWHFIYNGAGVAAGDINNDGLPDLYFAGNMVPDKLYLNKGNFRFEDITPNSGIGLQTWSSGVTMADVNADGLLDIYVSRNSPTGIHENNRNKLYINTGNNKFVEQAAKYGLDDIGFGIQSTFFDADHDGDLDMYLVNQPFDEFARLVNQPSVVAAYPETDRFFMFENEKFVDKTAALGLTNARYGLNVSIGDFDLNGWTDIYVCNDYHHADHLYMNDSGHFKDALQERTGHISFYSMGSDVADINQDGWLDIFSLDMAFEDHFRSKTNMGSMNRDRFWELVNDNQHYQYMQNALQVNMGNGYFAEMAQMAGVAKSDWSNSALFSDLDHDGDQDLLITNGILRDLRNNDFNAFVKEKYQNKVGPDNYLEVLKNLPSTPVRNIIFNNEGNLRFSKLTPEAGFDKADFSHGMAIADLNGDGLQDVVINNANAPASIYQNISPTNGHYIKIRLKGHGTNVNGLGCSVIVYTGDKKQINTMQTSRGYFSGTEALLHFGLGSATKIDSIKVLWDHKSMSVLKNIGADKEIIIQYSKETKVPFKVERNAGVQAVDVNTPLHVHKEEIFDDYQLQVLLPYKLSQNGPYITVADVNADGLDDFFIGGAAGNPGSIYHQQSGGVYSLSKQPALELDKGAEDQEAVFADIDKDNDVDLIVASGSNEFKEGSNSLLTRLYLNDGKGNFTKAGANIFPEIYINAQCIELFDADNDKDQDMFIGGRLVAGKYPLPASSKILINDQGRFTDKTKSLIPALQNFGMVTDAVSDDIDKDGDADLLITGEWMKPAWLINEGGKGFQLRVIDTAPTGLWWTVEKGDFDKDGDNDFLVGNLGWNNKFGGSRGTKLEVFANDFDRNGDYDVVLATTKDEKLLPVRGRECSSEEMPFILNKFPSYESYAKAELTEILTGDQMSSAMHEKLTSMSSVILINEAGGNFVSKELDIKCQSGPVKAFYVDDFNSDGMEDFIYGGNHFQAEVETARYDGLYPGVCFGDGKGNFDCKTIYINGQLRIDDVRDIKMIKSNGKEIILISTNNGPLRMYEIRG